MKKLRLLLLVPFLWIGSAFCQLTYTSDFAAISPFTAMKADTTFVNNTLLNLGTFVVTPDFDGQIHSFSFGPLTFNNIPNLDPTSPSDLQVGAGFTADVVFLAKDSSDVNNIGSESTLLGLGNQVLYPAYGLGSTATWHISALLATDLIFWHQDTSTGGIKFTMDDILHFTTFAATDALYQYYIFGIDDRGTSLQDFDDGVFGVRINLQPVGVLEGVPESSTYGLLGSGLLLGLVAFYRIKRKAASLA